jgi:hypothetical protein
MKTEDAPLAPGERLPDDERAKLEHEIASREKNLATARRERRESLRDGAAPRATEPHRNWHVYALGADLADCGLQGKDALALMGLRSLPMSRLVRLLLDAHDRQPGAYLARLLPGIIDAHRDELHARGLAVSLQRRWRAYQADLASWQAQPKDLKQGSWRERPMTAEQRELVRVTATLLDVPMPEGLTRGAAADWLEANGANLNYRKEV